MSAWDTDLGRWRQQWWDYLRGGANSPEIPDGSVETADEAFAREIELAREVVYPVPADVPIPTCADCCEPMDGREFCSCELSPKGDDADPRGFLAWLAAGPDVEPGALAGSDLKYRQMLNDEVCEDAEVDALTQPVPPVPLPFVKSD